MKAPWANPALLLISLFLTLTGYLGLVNGEEQSAWRLWLHGIAAYALIVLFIWKGTIILDALHRKNKWTRQRLIFFFLLALLLITVGLGLLWTFQGPLYLAGFSLVSLHIYVAVPVMLLMLYHTWKQRFIFRVKGTLDRRLFLGLGITAILGTLLWRSGGWLQSLLAWSGAQRRFTGSFEQGSFTGQFPGVSWINDNPPPIDFSSWELSVSGAVQKITTFAYEEMLALPAVEKEAVIDCTGGWYSRQVWTGITLDDLLSRSGLLDSAVSITIHSFTGFQRRFPIELASQMILAYNVAGRPLIHGHGAPLRLVIPGKRGVDWVKWVTAIQVNTTSALLQAPLPLT